ncbi:hypothetical protein [Streptomyces venezuelae]|uniref:hypothetical protein n=1 Tax=Streptomyces venezuelae TaxID=54571 RepID=UPI0037D5AB76
MTTSSSPSPGTSAGGVVVAGRVVVGAVAGAEEEADGAAVPVVRAGALGVDVVRLAEGEGEEDVGVGVRLGVGEDVRGSGLPELADGASDTARFNDALVVTSGTAARSSVPSPPPSTVAARVAVPATATAATAATSTPRLRPRPRPSPRSWPGGGGTSPTPRSSRGMVSDGSPAGPAGYASAGCGAVG